MTGVTPRLSVPFNARQIGGREDVNNIIKDEYVGRKKQNTVRSQSNTNNYQQVVERLTRQPLARAEQRVVMENKSYDL